MLSKEGPLTAPLSVTTKQRRSWLRVLNRVYSSTCGLRLCIVRTTLGGWSNSLQTWWDQAKTSLTTAAVGSGQRRLQYYMLPSSTVRGSCTTGSRPVQQVMASCRILPRLCLPVISLLVWVVLMASAAGAAATSSTGGARFWRHSQAAATSAVVRSAAAEAAAVTHQQQHWPSTGHLHQQQQQSQGLRSRPAPRLAAHRVPADPPVHNAPSTTAATLSKAGASVQHLTDKASATTEGNSRHTSSIRLRASRTLQHKHLLQYSDYSSSTITSSTFSSSTISSSSSSSDIIDTASDQQLKPSASKFMVPGVIIAAQGSDWQCIKRPGCKPSAAAYGTPGSFTALMPGGSGECKFFGGCAAVYAAGACSASWMWEVDVEIAAVIQWCGEQCFCPGEVP